MDKAVVVRLHTSFEDMVQHDPKTGVEFWCARDLQMLLGYAQWRNFATVIDKAITAHWPTFCQSSPSKPRTSRTRSQTSTSSRTNSGERRTSQRNIPRTTVTCAGCQVRSLWLLRTDGRKSEWVSPDRWRCHRCSRSRKMSVCWRCRWRSPAENSESPAG